MSLSMETLKRELHRALERAYEQYQREEQDLHDLLQANYIFGLMVGQGFDRHGRDAIFIEEELKHYQQIFEERLR